MPAKVYLKKGDNTRAFQDTLKIGDVPVDFTGYSSLQCHFRKSGTTVSVAANYVGAITDGVLTCSIPAEVYNVPGNWKQEWQVTYVNNTSLTVPTIGYNEITVTDVLP